MGLLQRLRMKVCAMNGNILLVDKKPDLSLPLKVGVKEHPDSRGLNGSKIRLSLITPCRVQ